MRCKADSVTRQPYNSQLDSSNDSAKDTSRVQQKKLASNQRMAAIVLKAL